MNVIAHTVQGREYLCEYVEELSISSVTVNNTFWETIVLVNTFNITIQSNNNAAFIHCCNHTAFCGCTLNSKEKTKEGKAAETTWKQCRVSENVSVFPSFLSLVFPCCIFPEEHEIQQTTAVSKQSKQITQSVLIVTQRWWMMMCPENTVRNILCYCKCCSCK